MNRKRFGKWISVIGLLSTGIWLLALQSCARSQELVSIAVQPSVENIGASTIPVSEDAGAQVQLSAVGTYIHPGVTKDITSQVVWASNTPQMFTVGSTGLLTATGESCGGTLVSATVTTNSSDGGISSSGAAVIGYMTANVVCFTGTTGGGGGTGPTITVSFLGSGSGTISSSPTGLSCANTAGTCTSTFPSGATVTLTAVPSGTFGGWASCDSVDGSGLICTINDLTAPRAITATFN